MNNIQPTQQQQQILEWDNNAVIIAGPGSGKTWTLAMKINQVLEECRTFQGVVGISYTNKASRELESRVKVLSKDIKQSFFGTIHSFCSREIVLAFGKKNFCSLNNEVLVEQTQSNEEIVKEIRNTTQSLIEKYSSYSIENLKDSGKNVIEELEDYHKEFLCQRFTEGYVDLGLINSLANLVLMSSENCVNYLKAKYKFIFVDEFQDSDYEQYNLFKRMEEIGVKSWAVGDYDQSIYSFKSGKPEYMEELTKNESFATFIMDINHRCHPFIQGYSNMFINLRRGKEIIPPEGDSRIARVTINGSQPLIGKWLNDSIDKIISMANVKYIPRIALLSRVHQSLEMISNELELPHGLEYKMLLKDDKSVGGTILSQLFIICFSPKQFTSIDFIQFHLGERQKGKRSTIDFVKSIIKEFKQTVLSDLEFKEKLNEILRQLKSIVVLFYPNYSLSPYTIKSCEEIIYNPILHENFKPNEESLQLMTVHGSKGLEFDIVIHVDLYEDALPFYKSHHNPTKLKEEENLHYIALTRAKELVVLITCTEKKFYSTNHDKYFQFPKKPSPYILGDVEKYQTFMI